MQKLKIISPFRLSSLLRLENDPRKAFNLFLSPNPNSPNPNSKPFRHSLLSYDLIISKLAKARMFPQLEIILQILKNDARIVPEEVIFCNIITYYGRAQLPDKALHVFDEIPSFRCPRTIKSVNTLLNSLLMSGEFGKMMELLARVAIGEFGNPDACTYNIVINACCRRNDLGMAWKVFDEMPKRGVDPNVVTFGTLIHGLCKNLEIEEAFQVKGRMERENRITPNSHIYVALIKGVCKMGELDRAVKLKDEMLRKKVGLDPAVYSTLITAFFKVGRKVEVPGLLEEMRKNGCKPDTVTYNALIHGFCWENDFVSAFGAIGEMESEGCKPDVISYNVIIAGLCRVGKVTEANELLEDMPRRKCAPDVVTYRKVFDGLCDVKRFKDAANLLDEMIFWGYTCPSSSVSKFVDRLVQDGERDLWAFLLCLVKRDSVDRCIWRFVVSLACKDCNADADKLFNHLMQNRSTQKQFSFPA